MKELAAPALTRGIPMVVALNAGTRVQDTKNQNSKGKLGARLDFHFSARKANGQTKASGEL